MAKKTITENRKKMLKTKLFKDWYYGPEKINQWLEQNPDITVVSTNTIANHGGWGYIILYEDNVKKTRN